MAKKKETKIISKWPRTNQMVSIPAGEFQMGSDQAVIHADGEGPARQVSLDSFWIDVHEVSNAEFDRFVQATGHITEVRTLRSQSTSACRSASTSIVNIYHACYLSKWYYYMYVYWSISVKLKE